MRWIDRFCAKHRRFGIPNLMQIIVFGTAVTYVLLMMDRSGRLASYMFFDADAVLHGQVWRLVTFIFIPSGSSLLTVALTLYFTYMIGTALEREWGQVKFTLYYLLGILFSALFGMCAYIFGGPQYGVLGRFVTATYINLSMFLCFATLYPNVEFLLFFIIPVKAKWLAYVDAAFLIISAIGLPGFMKLLPFIAVLNYPLFCWDEISNILRPLRGYNRSGAINFRRAAKKVRREQAQRPYASRCEVCGKTDTEYPNMEFRYCTQCEGYHCFCQEHINNHKHHTS